MTDQTEFQPEAVETAPLTPGFHVMHEGTSLGVYPTAADAEDFANAHPRHNGLTVEVVEVK